MERHGEIIRIKQDKLEEYKYYHANAWPEVNKMLRECNIQNYSIFSKGNYLFAYYEYVGEDYEGDMKKMSEDPKTQEWWEVVKPLQEPLEERKDGEWWANMEEVYHLA